MRLVLAILILPACVPDPWPAAREACGLAEGETLAWESTDRTGDAWNSLELDGACAERLVRDVHADPAELLAAFDGGDDLGAYLTDARRAQEPVDGLPVTIWGLLWTLGADFGAVRDLEAGPYVDPKWPAVLAEAAEARGLDADAPLSRVLYGLLSERIEGIDLLPDAAGVASAGLGSQDHVLYIPRTIATDFDYAEDPYAASVAAWVLAHESEHAVEGSPGHVPCGDWPAPACDEDLTGAQGFEIAMRWAQVQVLVDGAGCLDAANPDHLRAYDLESAIQDRYFEFVLSETPDRQLPRCD